MDIRSVPQQELINPRLWREYKRRMDALYFEVVTISTNTSLVSQISGFDKDLFDSPTGLLEYLAHNLVTQAILASSRTWGDKRTDVLTLGRTAEWILDSALLPRYRNEVRGLLDAAKPTLEVEATIERFRKIRHAQLAHLGIKEILGLKNAPEPVQVEELRVVAKALERYFDAMSISVTHLFVPVGLQAPTGAWHEGGLGYALEQVALGSRAVSLPDEDPQYFERSFREHLSRSDIESINALRLRRHKPTI